MDSLLSEPDGLPHFTDRLNRLMSTCLTVDDTGQTRRWNKQLLAKAMADVGCPISVGYIRRLLNGDQKNPTGRVLAGLTLVLGPPPAYWFDAAAAHEHNMAIDAQRRSHDMGDSPLDLPQRQTLPSQRDHTE